MVPIRKVRYLTFHGLGRPERTLPQGEANYWLDPGFFEFILDRVREEPDVYITFDDGNSSDFHIALPALIKRKLRARFFVVSERMGQPGFLSADQVKELDNAEMSIGSHGTQHRPWAQLSPKLLKEELELSRKALELLLKKPVDEAACPFGSYNRRVLNHIRSSGYKAVFTSDQGPAIKGRWFSPRNTIVRTDNVNSLESILRSDPKGFSALFRKIKILIKQWR
jgi:peptidoglycan/xylan/chitin deacetylase (PgdA/CDA1 family)